MMTPAEIVARTLNFEQPDRVARSFFDSDILGVSHAAQTLATDWRQVGAGRWERLDEWGNTWARLDPTSKGEVCKGALEEVTQQDALRFPDFSRPEDYAAVGVMRQKHPHNYLLGHLPGFAFNIARKLRRIDQYLMDLLEYETDVHALHDRIDSLIEDMIGNYAAQGVDGVMLSEDWGTQQQLLIPPALWHAEFRPRFQKLCNIAHDLGLTVWMHSCGNITAIIPALMEAGVDVLQFDQPEVYGFETLANFQQKGPITFWCPVDIQKTLPTGNRAVIRARARAMLDILWRGGGFIAGYYPDAPSIGVASAWQEYACHAFVDYGVRKVNAT